MSERRLFAHEIGERLDELLQASTSHRAIERSAAALAALPRARQELVLRWVGAAAQSFVEIGHMIAMQAPQALAALDEAGFEAWVLAGLDACDKHGMRPAMETLRDIEGFAAMRSGRVHAAFAEAAQRLQRFIHGLSGRPLALKEGELAWTDTENIYLPARLTHFASAADNHRLYKTLAVRLWAQTRYGAFAVDLEAAIAAWPQRETALAWLAQLEAVRLEACVMRDLPGLGALLAAGRDEWAAALRPALGDLQAPQADVNVSLSWLERLMAAGVAPPPPTFVGHLDPQAAARTRAQRIERDKNTLRQALAKLQGAAGRRAAAPKKITARLDADSDQVAFDINGEAATLPLDAQAAAQSLLLDLGALPPEALTPAGDGAWTPAERHAGADAAAAQGGASGALFYDEWDYHRNAWRRDWCHVYVSDGKSGDGAFVRATRRRHASHINQIRRRFEALRGEDRILKRQDEGEDIDIDALVEAVNDRRCGAEPSPRLFRRRQRSERSLAAMFMIDMSGSTRGWVNDAEREALVMLCEALESLGDSYAIYGFSGWTRTRCDIFRIKSFSDAWDDAVRARIDGIEARDYTRMGAAIRHLSSLLAARGERHKLLVTLSDGRPDDFGDEYRGVYGVEDTRRALQEAHAIGIRSYCVTIDRHGADYLRRMVGPAGFTVLDDVKRLPFKIAEIYRRLTS